MLRLIDGEPAAAGQRDVREKSPAFVRHRMALDASFVL
jgi:hypothetical protein